MSWDRVTDQRQAAVIGQALTLMPAAMPRPVFFCGDPIFSGLHGIQKTNDGRSYRNTAHCCYPHHIERPASDRLTTIVLPRELPLKYMVHELGHVLDWWTGFTHRAKPVTQYATTNAREAFAESWTAWLLPDYLPWGRDTLLQDKPTVHLFGALYA